MANEAWMVWRKRLSCKSRCWAIGVGYQSTLIERDTPVIERMRERAAGTGASARRRIAGFSARNA
jgi:hypothetical protein